MYRNIAKMDTATTGTGTITLVSAVAGFLSLDDAGYADNELVTFVIEDGTEREITRGKYDTTGPTLTRDRVLASTNSGSKISLSGSATVFVGLAAEDVVNVDPAGWLLFADDFISGSAETGEIGQLNWIITTVTAGLGFSEAHHPGVIRTFYTGTSNGAGMSLGASLFSCGSIDEMVFIVQPQYTVANTTNLRFGVSDTIGIGSTAHGAFIERLAADTSWYGVVMNSSTETRTTNPLLADASANNAWHKFNIRRIDASNWSFSVDDGTPEVITGGNVPDDADLVFPTVAQYNTSGANSNVWLVDYFDIRILPRTRF